MLGVLLIPGFLSGLVFGWLLSRPELELFFYIKGDKFFIPSYSLVYASVRVFNALNIWFELLQWPILESMLSLSIGSWMVWSRPRSHMERLAQRDFPFLASSRVTATQGYMTCCPTTRALPNTRRNSPRTRLGQSVAKSCRHPRTQTIPSNNQHNPRLYSTVSDVGVGVGLGSGRSVTQSDHAQMGGPLNRDA